MTDNEKKRISAKIRALMAKTVDSGCTEAEAMAAASAAKAMMDKYQISMTEAQLREEDVVQSTYKSDTLNISTHLLAVIGRFCEVKPWVQSYDNGEIVSFTFLGLKSDVEFAEWLISSLESFIIINANNWVKENAKPKPYQKVGNTYVLKQAYIKGALISIWSNLDNKVKERELKKDKQTSDGKSLIVVKQSIVDQAFRDIEIHLEKSDRETKWYSDNGATEAGRQKGNTARFDRPMDNTDETKLIG